MKVVVSCSTKFHAFALAEQLDRLGDLDTFYTSYAFQKDIRFRKVAKRVDKENIDPKRIKTNILLAIFIKSFPKYSHFWNNLFDLWVAYKMRRSDANVFIGWSGMSLHTIKKVKQMGIKTLLERGSSHIEFQNEILADEFKKFGRSFHINPKVIQKEIKEYTEVDYISIPSDFVRDSFLSKQIPDEKLIKNNYGVSNYFNVPENAVKNDKFTVLYFGGLSVQKGLIYLFDALENLSIPKEKFEVWFIGTILDPEISDLIENYNHSNWVFLGQLNHYELADQITKTHIAVQPSLQEGLSTVIPQMMACDIPVIASYHTGGGDLITDGINGFIVPIRDSDSIKNRIEEIYSDPSLLERLVSGIQENSHELSWDNYGDRYHSNLLKVIQ